MNKKLEQSEKLINELKDVTPENLDDFVHESLKLFHDVLGKLQSQDPKEREEALALAEKLRTSLEEQAEKAMDAVQMSAKELESFTSNPENFSKEEWEALQKAKTNLGAFQEEINRDRNKPTLKKGPSKKKNLWIAG